MWNLQIHSLLDGYALAGHLTGSTPKPSETIIDGDTVVVNSQHNLLMHQDKLIYSALIGAITTELQPLVSRTTNASQIWETLSSTYAKPSRGHIKRLKTQIKEWKKESKTIDIYLQGLTTRMDQLANLGKAMEHKNQIDLILEGLPDDYKSVVDQVEGRDTTPTITELHEKLLKHEAKLLNIASTQASPFPVTANAAKETTTPIPFIRIVRSITPTTSPTTVETTATTTT